MPFSYSPSREGASIVMLGNFNPAILHPVWLTANKLIREDEAKLADGEQLLVTSDVTKYACAWFQLEVTSDRFAVATADPAFLAPLKDLAHGIFSVLEHTPLRSMGLNRFLHFQMPDEERWHALGDFLVPKAPWKDLFESRAGMRSVVLEGRRPGSEAEYLRVTVQPSVKVRPGVYFGTNEHYVAAEENARSAGALMGVLTQNWDGAMSYARHVVDHILGQEF